MNDVYMWIAVVATFAASFLASWALLWPRPRVSAGATAEEVAKQMTDMLDRYEESLFKSS